MKSLATRDNNMWWNYTHVLFHMAVLYLYQAGDHNQDLKPRSTSDFSIPFCNKFRGASYEKLSTNHLGNFFPSHRIFHLVTCTSTAVFKINVIKLTEVFNSFCYDGIQSLRLGWYTERQDKIPIKFLIRNTANKSLLLCTWTHLFHFQCFWVWKL